MGLTIDVRILRLFEFERRALLDCKSGSRPPPGAEAKMFGSVKLERNTLGLKMTSSI
jgi:hypothetical protein